MITIDQLDSNGIRFVETKFLDLNGLMRSRTYPVNRFITNIKDDGFGFDASSIGFASVEDSDGMALPIDGTLRLSPCKKSAIVLCDIIKNGTRLEGVGRTVLRRLLEKIPYEVYVGPEIEFYITKNKKTDDSACYMYSNPWDGDEVFKKEFLEILKETNPDFEILVSHHEVSPGHHEFEMKYEQAIEIINKLIAFKFFLQRFAEMKGLEVTYMPKPFYGIAGSGMHFHMSLRENGKTIFYKDKRDVSDFAKQYIAGILKYAREIALVTNGSINSYKRLVKHHEAPVFCLWGHGNRTTMIRIPTHHDLIPKSARIEIRAPDALNDYFLTVAALVSAGLKGVEEGLEPQEPYTKNADHLTEEEFERLEITTLPQSLKESIEEAKRGKILKNLLGPMFHRFIKIKESDWKDYSKHCEEKEISPETKKVTDWEIKKYYHM